MTSAAISGRWAVTVVSGGTSYDGLNQGVVSTMFLFKTVTLLSLKMLKQLRHVIADSARLSRVFFSDLTQMKTFHLVCLTHEGRVASVAQELLWPTGVDSGMALCDSCRYLTVSLVFTLSSWGLNTSVYGL